jgi:hypothetical protein
MKDISDEIEFDHVQCIVCEKREISLGLDIKFEDDPFNVKLHGIKIISINYLSLSNTIYQKQYIYYVTIYLKGIMHPSDYTSEMNKINEALKECRSTNVDFALLSMGATMLPLIPFAIRLKKHKKQRKKIMARCVNEFNKEHSDLFMRWQTRPEKKLVIMTIVESMKLLKR